MAHGPIHLLGSLEGPVNMLQQHEPLLVGFGYQVPKGGLGRQHQFSTQQHYRGYTQHLGSWAIGWQQQRCCSSRGRPTNPAAKRTGRTGTWNMTRETAIWCCVQPAVRFAVRTAVNGTGCVAGAKLTTATFCSPGAGAAWHTLAVLRAFKNYYAPKAPLAGWCDTACVASSR